MDNELKEVQEMQNENQIKADAINEFITHMIAALEAGFIDRNTASLAEIHRVGQNYIKDHYDIDMPNIVEQWGDEVARAAGFPLNDKS